MRVARVMRPRHYEVHITRHGYKRYCERMEKMGSVPLSIKKLHKVIRAHLNDKIGRGVKLETRIGITPGLDAVLVYGAGGWVVVTFKYWYELASVGLGA